MTNEPKKIIFYQKARSKLLKGLLKLAIKLDAKPSLLGVKFLQELSLSDPHENIGFKLGVDFLVKIRGTRQIKLSFLKILYALIKSGINWIDKKRDSFLFLQALKKAQSRLTGYLLKNANTLQSFEELFTMAKTITQDDAILTYLKQYLSKDALINELQIHAHYADPLHTSNHKKIELENVQVAVYNKEVESIFELLPLLESKANTFVIAAKKFAPDLLATLAINRVENIKKIYPLIVVDLKSLEKLQAFIGKDNSIAVDKVILSEKSTSIMLTSKNSTISCSLDHQQQDIYNECLEQLKEAKKVPIIKNFYPPLITELQAAINADLEITQDTQQYIPMTIFENNLTNILSTVELLIQTDAAIAADDMIS